MGFGETVATGFSIKKKKSILAAVLGVEMSGLCVCVLAGYRQGNFLWKVKKRLIGRDG